MVDKHNFLVVMAGGTGTRFWPYSREEYPKQFQDILGIGKTLLQLTVGRFESICPVENVYVVTNKRYQATIRKQLPQLGGHQILLEPIKRNTAPCIAYACYKIGARDSEARIIVTPSDHAIFEEKSLHKIVDKSLNEVKKGNKLITIGIKPTRPETGYGYIQFIKGRGFLKKVKTFTEKPAMELATKFVDSGEFLWNAGIFIWNAQAIEAAVRSHLPDLDEIFAEVRSSFFTKKEQPAIDKAYSLCRNISIDYGIMEKSPNVYVALGSFGWSDLGSWDSLYDISEKDQSLNVIDGNAMSIDSTECIINGPKDQLIVFEGLKGYLIAQCGNVTIVCRKDNEKKFREMVNRVKSEKGDEYV